MSRASALVRASRGYERDRVRTSDKEGRNTDDRLCLTPSPCRPGVLPGRSAGYNFACGCPGPMSIPSPHSASDVNPSSAGKRLESWKEIAVYLNRSVRTLHRWEKEEGLPVHRQLHKELGSVFAFKSELDAWARARSVRTACLDETKQT